LGGSFALQALHTAAAMENKSTKGNKSDIDMWIAKPIYESLPYFYLLAGVISLGLSMYLNYWYMPTICFVLGLGCLIAGLVVLLKRRDHRVNERRVGQRQDY
jgi:protein-S-isoprenylcysteine O-methyltransferase Ste14